MEMKTSIEDGIGKEYDVITNTLHSLTSTVGIVRRCQILSYMLSSPKNLQICKKTLDVFSVANKKTLMLRLSSVQFAITRNRKQQKSSARTARGAAQLAESVLEATSLLNSTIRQSIISNAYVAYYFQMKP